uniref:Uncharacterized protein n=1 Tax=Candidatus Kentrum sp. LFY TaxID=2126342 RepID=A0A450URU5_9GAMM|nr:MAG: hypothetical protein BECKLFY1418A_GA0070994_104714 [Candidatus Kentron sp. LFY]
MFDMLVILFGFILISIVFLLSLIELARLRRLCSLVDEEKSHIFKKNMRIHFRFENPALFDFVNNSISSDGNEISAIKVKLQRGRKIILFLSSLFFSILILDVLVSIYR